MRGRKILKDARNTDKLFNNKIAKKAFQTFLKFGGVPPAETSASTLVRFNAIVTVAIETLGIIFEKLEEINSPKTEIVNEGTG